MKDLFNYLMGVALIAFYFVLLAVIAMPVYSNPPHKVMKFKTYVSYSNNTDNDTVFLRSIRNYNLWNSERISSYKYFDFPSVELQRSWHYSLSFNSYHLFMSTEIINPAVSVNTSHHGIIEQMGNIPSWSYCPIMDRKPVRVTLFYLK